jgi:hypothetical protein
MHSIDRRMFIAGSAALAFAAPGEVLAQARPGLVMWKDPGCPCCGHWAERVQAASIRGLIVEGHVPPADIQRLLATRGRAFSGLAVPGMPAGAPGMDVGHSRHQPYRVTAFGPDGRRAVYARYG